MVARLAALPGDALSGSSRVCRRGAAGYIVPGERPVRQRRAPARGGSLGGRPVAEESGRPWGREALEVARDAGVFRTSSGPVHKISSVHKISINKISIKFFRKNLSALSNVQEKIRLPMQITSGVYH